MMGCRSHGATHSLKGPSNWFEFDGDVYPGRVTWPPGFPAAGDRCIGGRSLRNFLNCLLTFLTLGGHLDDARVWVGSGRVGRGSEED